MSVLSELSQSARSLSKSPSLPLIAVLSLGLGVGVNTTLYSVVKSMLLDDISAAEPSRLVRAWVGGTNRMSYANFRDMEDTRAFQGWAGYTLYIIKQQTGSNTDKVWGQLVTGNYFDVLGVKAALGRTFSPEEASPERNPLVAVISNSYWRQQFGGDPGVLGREMRLNGETFTIIGVLPEDHRGILGFSFAPKIYVPFSTALNAELLNRAQTSILEAFGRLAHGVSEPQARTALLTRAEELKHRFPAVNEHLNQVQLYGMSGWRKFSAKGFPVPVLVFSALLLGMSGMVLLIACANIAGLLLARGVNRQRDIAVRLALGASKSDIFAI
jgi:ABC-type antimicrobial peptide transport system permease subunit